MYRRICILVLTVLAAESVCFARTAGPGMRGPEITSPNINSPDGFKPDSLNTATSERNQRLYDSIQSKTNRRAVPRMLYKMLFVKPVLDTTMSGRVTDESGAPVIGATVILKGTTTGTATNAAGEYAIDIRQADAVLVYSLIGYNKVEVALSEGQTQADVTLKSEAIAMDNVVVVGLSLIHI